MKFVFTGGILTSSFAYTLLNSHSKTIITKTQFMKTTITGILIGNDQEGYTSFFKEIPIACAEGRTKKEAQMNLLGMIKFMSEYMEENFIEHQNDSNEENDDRLQTEFFTADLVLA